MKNIKIFFYKIWRFLYYFGVLTTVVLVIAIIVILYKEPYWFAIDSCFDTGGVWDYNERRCREDCLKWNEAYGCIKLTPEQVEIFKQCGSVATCPSDKVYKEICQNNDKRWDDKRKECDFETPIEKTRNLRKSISR